MKNSKENSAPAVSQLSRKGNRGTVLSPPEFNLTAGESAPLQMKADPRSLSKCLVLEQLDDQKLADEICAIQEWLPDNPDHQLRGYLLQTLATLRQEQHKRDHVEEGGEQTTEEMIAAERDNFGISEEDEKLSANFYSKGKSDKLRALNPENIDKYTEKYKENTDHFQTSLANFRKSGLAKYRSGEDIPLIAAIGTREGGGNILRTDDTKIVSGGQDTHKKGASGLDNLYNYREHFKLSDGEQLYIGEVKKDDPDLLEPERNPAWIKAKDLLFAHMLTSAGHEQLFLSRILPMKLKELGLTDSPEALWANLTVNARRTWLSLFYSGVGYVGGALEALLNSQKEANTPSDLNGIITHDFATYKHKARIILARATALRALAFEKVAQ